MLSRTIVLLIASLTMANPTEGKQTVSLAPVTPNERKLVYEGMADAGRIRLELWSSGTVGARYANHPRAVSKNKPWNVEVQFNPSRIASLVDKATGALQQALTQGATAPSLLQPGMDVALKSVTVIDLVSKKALGELSFMETPPALAATITELQALYLELKHAAKTKDTIGSEAQ